MTPQSVISEVRGVIKDDDSTSYRNSDASLVLAVNRALKRVALLRPDLFTSIGTITLVAGVNQTVPDYGRIVEVYAVQGGNAITEANRETMDQLTPTWRTETADDPVNWMRHSRNPSKFFVYPPAVGGEVVECEYTITPPTVALNDTIALADLYHPVVVDITAAEVEWADDENVLNQRAETFYKRAIQALGVDMQGHNITDAEAGGGAKGAID